MPTKEDLKYFQSMPLDIKVAMTKTRIREWVNYYGESGTYVSFSGGKDSTVLLHLVRQLYSDVEAVFVNTGLEYIEIQKFVKKFDNVKILKPEMSFKRVISEFGYPVISKDVSHRVYFARRGKEWALKYVEGRATDGEGNKSLYNIEKWKPLMNVDFLISSRCCYIMKKNPIHKYQRECEKVPIVATMAEESRLREQAWIRTGCNLFDNKQPLSKPMSFWTEQDVLRYIKENNLEIAEPYGEIIPEGGQLTIDDSFNCKLCTTEQKRTGCIFCMYGAHLENDEGRFQRLKRTHPKQYAYCMEGGAYDSDGLWKPNDKGLGMKHVIDVLNDIYGKDFIKY